MSRLEDAQKRLQDAFRRLDAAVENLGDRSVADGLEEELAAARDRCSMLESRSKTVSRKLDETIGRMQELLEE